VHAPEEANAMSGGRIAALVSGVLMAVLGLGLLTGGAGILWADGRDGSLDGTFTSPTYTLETSSAALVSEELALRAPTPADWFGWPDDARFGLVATGVEDRAIFAGIGSTHEVEAYLDGVPHAAVTWLGPGRSDVALEETTGNAVATPPSEQPFWSARAVGPGQQELRWAPESGDWTLVVLNADGTPGVRVDAKGYATVPALLAVGTWLAVAGGLLGLAGVALVAVAAASGTTGTPARAGSGAAGGADLSAAPAAGTYPLRLTGRLDEPLSRGLWLLKWVLLLPHVLVLGLLWIAFSLLTLVAGVAILLTGRYPRGIFDVNVGILRWTWRVVYYGYSALGTDRYPPFSTAPADYPAALDVDYPERLSRGLVLVKWWLLALPHYLIVAVLAGGGLTWTVRGDRLWSVSLAGGLVGLLVLVAGVTLLLTGRYPPRLHDLVVGCNRWVYRVIAYAALMTDVYPPFRLDSGPDEHAPTEPPPASPTAGTSADAPLTTV
jgi:hypothetical protein